MKQKFVRQARLPTGAYPASMKGLEYYAKKAIEKEKQAKKKL